MRNRIIVLLAVAIALTAIVTSSALAKKPDDPGKPTPVPTAAPSCYERVNVYGATAWNLGGYDDQGSDTYSATGLPACIDITEAHHLYAEPTATDHPTMAAMRWSVKLTGEASRFKGIKLVFEQGVHGTVFAEIEIGPDSAWIDLDTGHYVFHDTVVWTTTEFTPSGEPVSLVAMPQRGDSWVTTPIVTLYPLHKD
jgi:hypothetical protein